LASYLPTNHDARARKVVAAHAHAPLAETILALEAITAAIHMLAQEGLCGGGDRQPVDHRVPLVD
jgi:hypothetical protein